MRKTRKPRRLGVLTKALRILELLRLGGDNNTLTRIAEKTGYDMSTVYRLLNHLEQEGYLHRNPAGAYTIGENLQRFAMSGAGNGKLREVARPFLWGLWKATSEAVHLGILDGAEVVYVDALESPLELRMVSTIGIRAEFYRTALGKAMAAFLPDEELEPLIAAASFRQFTVYTIADADQLRSALAMVRSRGYAVDHEEGHLGVCCVGTPIFGYTGRIAAALSISAPTSRLTPERVQPLAHALLDAAREISAILGWKPAGTARDLNALVS